MSRSKNAHPSTTARDPIGAPRVHLPSEAAQRLNISTSMLRKLTLCGAIGHVRLGVGDQRHRIGYTEAQIVDFIAARTVPAGEGSIEAVAHDLTMSARTLQRRLRAEGTTFQSVLDSTRESLARHYLAESELSAGEISFLLGYADPRSFYRAVQAWTGQTPQLVRDAAG